MVNFQIVHHKPLYRQEYFITVKEKLPQVTKHIISFKRVV